MKYLDLIGDYQRVQAQIDASMRRVLEHGRYVLGPEVSELEAQLAGYVGVSHALALSSGTAALHVALLALDLKPGDEVITSPFSFFATAETIILAGATPVFVDIDEQTFNIDADKITAAITDRTRAIIPVSLYGQCADFVKINAIAEQHGLVVIEDAAQSFGATQQGRRSGGLSTIACTSFYPTKPLGCLGDGGACFTNDDSLAEKMRLIANHGQSAHYQHTCIGLNYRFNTLQAAILLPKLAEFDAVVAKRQQVASWYAERLAEHAPKLLKDNTSVYAQYTVRVKAREAVQAELRSQDIPTAVHYPIPLHQQPAIQPYVQDGLRFVLAEKASQEVMSLPFYPEMPESAVEQVCTALLPHL